MAMKLRRKLSLIAAAAVIVALAACDTQPATDVATQAATLNAKGACAGGGYGGTNQYQLRNVSAGGGFYDVGPRFRFDCTQATGEVALNSHRETGLTPGTRYAFRLVSRLDNGSVQTWDANGTNGGTAYDTFVTEQIVAVDEHPADAFVGSPDGSATASSCRNKEIRNIRRGRSSVFGTLLWTIELRTTWRYCSNGKITMMWPATTDCFPSSAGASLGYDCLNKGTKIRAISTGGNPEHAVYTYSYDIVGKEPFKGITFFRARWCATNQISGSGAHYRHGSCEIQPWPGS
jgi:hypothetical protein